MDPCGQAGGKYKETPVGGDSVFATVSLDGKTYQMGDLGSRVLPPNHPSEVANWTVGSTPRVAWGMRFNHGGGYQYRLCPLEKMPCSEEDFQKMPLDFVRDAHAIVSVTTHINFMDSWRLPKVCLFILIEIKTIQKSLVTLNYILNILKKNCLK